MTSQKTSTRGAKMTRDALYAFTSCIIIRVIETIKECTKLVRIQRLHDDQLICNSILERGTINISLGLHKSVHNNWGSFRKRGTWNGSIMFLVRT